MNVKAGFFSLLMFSAAAFANERDETLINKFMKQELAKEISKMPDKKASIQSIRFLTEKKINKIWTGYFFVMKISLTEDGETKVAPSKFIMFTDGQTVTGELPSHLAKNIVVDLTPKIEPLMYDEDHYVAGNKNAKHKIVVFSDPICPGCRNAIPKILDKVRKNPKDYVLYFYHFPLEQIHPQAAGIVKSMNALERLGKHDVIDRVYRGEVDSVDDLQRIYGKFKITKKDVEKYKNDLEVTERMAVAGTPSLYYDGESDPFGKKFFNK